MIAQEKKMETPPACLPMAPAARVLRPLTTTVHYYVRNAPNTQKSSHSPNISPSFRFHRAPQPRKTSQTKTAARHGDPVSLTRSNWRSDAAWWKWGNWRSKYSSLKVQPHNGILISKGNAGNWKNAKFRWRPNRRSCCERRPARTIW